MNKLEEEKKIFIMNELEEEKQLSIYNELDGENQVSLFYKLNIMKNIKNRSQTEKNLNYLSSESKSSTEKLTFIYIPKVTIKENDLYNQPTVIIQWSMTEFLNANGKLDMDEIRSKLPDLNDIYFEIKCPSLNFESIYKDLVKMKRKDKSFAKIAVYITIDDIQDLIMQNEPEFSFARFSSNITSIGNCFCNIPSLVGIEIPSSVTYICRFSNNSSLTYIEIPSSIKLIDFEVFENCSSLKKVILPPTLKAIEEYAFLGCTSLTIILIPASVTCISSCVFGDCSSLTTVEMHSSIEYIYGDAFNGCKSLSQISIPPSVISIGSDAFNGCESLSKIEIPSSVKEIEKNAFYGCTSLTKVEIPYSVTVIGTNAFGGCTSLNEITLPSFIDKNKIGLDSRVNVKWI